MLSFSFLISSNTFPLYEKYGTWISTGGIAMFL